MGRCGPDEVLSGAGHKPRMTTLHQVGSGEESSISWSQGGGKGRLSHGSFHETATRATEHLDRSQFMPEHWLRKLRNTKKEWHKVVPSPAAPTPTSHRRVRFGRSETRTASVERDVR